MATSTELQVSERALCEICTDRAAGVHYGRNLCEGCKAFFKRHKAATSRHEFRCYFGNQCVITPQTRNNCKACRVQKCLDLGMGDTCYSRAKRKNHAQPDSQYHDSLPDSTTAEVSHMLAAINRQTDTSPENHGSSDSFETQDSPSSRSSTRNSSESREVSSSRSATKYDNLSENRDSIPSIYKYSSEKTNYDSRRISSSAMSENTIHSTMTLHNESNRSVNVPRLDKSTDSCFTEIRTTATRLGTTRDYDLTDMSRSLKSCEPQQCSGNFIGDVKVLGNSQFQGRIHYDDNGIIMEKRTQNVDDGTIYTGVREEDMNILFERKDQSSKLLPFVKTHTPPTTSLHHYSQHGENTNTEMAYNHPKRKWVYRMAEKSCHTDPVHERSDNDIRTITRQQKNDGWDPRIDVHQATESILEAVLARGIVAPNNERVQRYVKPEEANSDVSDPGPLDQHQSFRRCHTFPQSVGPGVNVKKTGIMNEAVSKHDQIIDEWMNEHVLSKDTESKLSCIPSSQRPEFNEAIEYFDQHFLGQGYRYDCKRRRKEPMDLTLEHDESDRALLKSSAEALALPLPASRVFTIPVLRWMTELLVLCDDEYDYKPGSEPPPRISLPMKMYEEPSIHWSLDCLYGQIFQSVVVDRACMFSGIRRKKMEFSENFEERVGYMIADVVMATKRTKDMMDLLPAVSTLNPEYKQTMLSPVMLGVHFITCLSRLYHDGDIHVYLGENKQFHMGADTLRETHNIEVAEASLQMCDMISKLYLDNEEVALMGAVYMTSPGDENYFRFTSV